ncbi:site-2 protease family protein [Rothia uropygioeca]|uniref:site-2 protease family protein n=1 Tax=Kocuria sp. 257 TaxID=2021970 RepID=UPI0010118145|nr:site-2 protease family protein [Kocuria sp. 257]
MNSAEGLFIGRIAGIPVRLSRSWFVLTLLIVFGYGSYLTNRFSWLGPGAYLAALAFAVLLAVSVLIHELSHGLTAKSFGWSVGGINLTLMGGHTTFQSGRSDAGRSALVSLAGPVANLILAGIGWAAMAWTGVSGWPALVLYLLTTSNGFVGIFNLLPGIPLDGGYAVEAIVWKMTGKRDTGTRTAVFFGFLTAAALLAWLVLSGAWHSVGMVVLTFMVAFIVMTGSMQAYRSIKVRQAVGGLSVAALARPTTPVAASLPLSEFPPLSNARGVFAVTDQDGRGLGVVDGQAMMAADAAGDASATAETLMVAVAWDRPVPAGLNGQALVSHIAQLPGRIWPVASWNGQNAVLFESDVIDAVKRAQPGQQ